MILFLKVNFGSVCYLQIGTYGKITKFWSLHVWFHDIFVVAKKQFEIIMDSDLYVTLGKMCTMRVHMNSQIFWELFWNV